MLHDTAVKWKAKYRLLADTRFILGVTLIISCILVGIWLFTLGRAPHQALQFKQDLPIGHVLQPEDLITVEVNLAGAASSYPDELPSQTPILLSPGHRGELLRLSDLGQVGDLDSSVLVVNLSAPVPNTVTVGSTVELWSTPKQGANETSTPQCIAREVQVTDLLADSNLVSHRQPTLQVRVKKEDVAQVLNWLGKSGSLVAVQSG